MNILSFIFNFKCLLFAVYLINIVIKMLFTFSFNDKNQYQILFKSRLMQVHKANINKNLYHRIDFKIRFKNWIFEFFFFILNFKKL